jgi:type II secretory pathway component GspD/PulD (secretin)
VAWVFRCVALVSLATVTLASDTVVEVFPLRNRPAQDLLPAVRAVVGNEGVVEALDTRLVVRATPAALARIRAALPALDVAPRTLSVTVSQRRDAETSARAGSARIETGRAPSAGGTGETRTRTVVTGAFSASSSSAEGEDVQQMRVLEGHPAFIRVGRAVPVAVTGVVETPGGPVPATGTAFAESGTGFYVLARGAGDGVVLELWTEATTGDDRGRVEGQKAHATVDAPLGEWIEVGSVLHESVLRRGVPWRAQDVELEERRVRVRVDWVR